MELLIKALEGGTYLASILDGENNYLVFGEDNQPKAFHCLNEIKEYLSQDRFEKVWLQQDTPYDEMCGMPSDTSDGKMEIDWH